MSCPLCKRERKTHWYYEDHVVWIADCSSHPDKVLIVLKRHSRLPTPEETEHMEELKRRFFPEKEFRYPRSILDHFHFHEL